MNMFLSKLEAKKDMRQKSYVDWFADGYFGSVMFFFVANAIALGVGVLIGCAVWLID